MKYTNGSKLPLLNLVWKGTSFLLNEFLASSAQEHNLSSQY